MLTMCGAPCGCYRKVPWSNKLCAVRRGSHFLNPWRRMPSCCSCTCFNLHQLLRHKAIKGWFASLAKLSMSTVCSHFLPAKAARIPASWYVRAVVFVQSLMLTMCGAPCGCYRWVLRSISFGPNASRQSHSMPLAQNAQLLQLPAQHCSAADTLLQHVANMRCPASSAMLATSTVCSHFLPSKAARKKNN
jgi:hypothetical protein